MTNVNEIGLFLDGYKPNLKKPILTWTKKKISRDLRAEYHLKEGEGISCFYNMNLGRASHVLTDILPEEEKDNYVFFNKKRGKTFRYTIEYIKAFDGFVFCQVQINTDGLSTCYANTAYVKRFWEITSKIFINRDKSVIYKDTEGIYDRGEWKTVYAKDYTLHEKIDKFSPFNIISINKDLAGASNESWEELSKPLLQVFPRFCNVGGNRTVDICKHPRYLLEFLKYKEPKIKLTKTQKIINNLVSLPLKDISYSDTYDDKMAFIERVSDGEKAMSVIRTMVKDTKNKVMVDAARIYVSKNDVIACKPDNDGGFIKMMLKTSAVHWDFSLFEFDEDAVKDTKLEYFGSIVNKVPKKIQAKFLWSLLTYPFIEQLCKVGFESDVFNIVEKTYYGRIISPFTGLFGDIDLSKKSLTNALGINKYQLKRLVAVMHDKDNFPNGEENNYNYWGDCFFSPLISIKRALDVEHGINLNYYSNKGDYGVKDISHLDNDTFEFLLDMAQKIHRACIYKINDVPYYDCTKKNRFIVALSLINRLYGFSTLKNMVEPILSIIDKQVRLTTFYGSHLSALDLYLDYLDMVVQLDDTAHFRAKFDPDNIETIEAMHDLISDVFKCKKQEVDAKKFQEVIKKCDKWTFGDDTYTVIAPFTPNDVAKEGIELHHCVGSYIQRIINELTNILFIRKNDELDKPFFTVEITNDDTLQQVHGFGNRNSDTEPGLDNFIKKWVKERKLKTSNFNKVR